jgi:hypothetical protein
MTAHAMLVAAIVLVAIGPVLMDIASRAKRAPVPCRNRINRSFPKRPN